MKKLNLSNYKTSAGAAKALHKFICEKAKELDQKPEIEVLLLTPARSKELGYGEAWRVMWEAGPYQWASRVIGGASIYSGELGVEAEPQIIGFDSIYWKVSNHYSFDIGFTK